MINEHQNAPGDAQHPEPLSALRVSLPVRAHGWHKPPPRKGLHPSASIWDKGCSRSASLGTPQRPKDDNWLSKLCIPTPHTSPQTPLQNDCISFKISTGGIQLLHKQGPIPPPEEEEQPCPVFTGVLSETLWVSHSMSVEMQPLPKPGTAQQRWVKT